MTLSVSLHLLAWAPETGRVVDQLLPVLGESAAFRLQEQLLARSLMLDCPGVADRFLWYAERADDPLEGMAEQAGWTVMEQPPGELGERMRRIAALGLLQSDAVILLGAECPALDGAYLADAVRALERHEWTFGPTEAGGYVLIGLRRMDAALFLDVPWEGDDMLTLACAHLQRLGWSHHLLPPLWDASRLENLARLAEVGVHLGH
jgi:hypothetical protein